MRQLIFTAHNTEPIYRHEDPCGPFHGPDHPPFRYIGRKAMSHRTKISTAALCRSRYFLFRHKFQVMTRTHGIPNPDGRHTEYQLFHYGTVDIFSPHAEHVPAFIDADACGAMPCRIRTERTTGHQPRLHGSARALSARTGPTCRTRAGPEPIRKDGTPQQKERRKERRPKTRKKDTRKKNKDKKKRRQHQHKKHNKSKNTATTPPNQNQDTRKNTMGVLHLAARKPP